jgi:hypothetical protein
VLAGSLATSARAQPGVSRDTGEDRSTVDIDGSVRSAILCE